MANLYNIQSIKLSGNVITGVRSEEIEENEQVWPSQKVVSMAAVKGLFNKQKDDELVKKIKENPEAAKQKVKVPDQKKLNKLYDDSIKKIKNGEDPEKVDSWFKKHAKAILVTTAVSISVGALFIARDRNYKEALSKAEQRANDLDKMYQETISELNTLKTDRMFEIDNQTRKSEVDNQNYLKQINDLKGELDNAKIALNREKRSHQATKELSEIHKWGNEYGQKIIGKYANNVRRLNRRLRTGKYSDPSKNVLKKAQGMIRVTNSFKEFSKKAYDYNNHIIVETCRKTYSNPIATFNKNPKQINESSYDEFDKYLENAYDEFSTVYDYNDYLEF